jgi:hypothetical protein
VNKFVSDFTLSLLFWFPVSFLLSFTGSFKERFNAAKINIYLSQKYNILSNLTRVISL